MKRLKIIYIIWAIFVIIILGLITLLGIEYNKKLKPYIEAEKKLVNYTQKYVELKFIYPEEGEKLKITLEDLKKEELLEDLSVNNNSCDGYVAVSKKGVYKYKAYIKCDNYKTKGY